MNIFPGWRSMATALVPDGFDVPTELSTVEFRLVRLDERHNDGDYAAWMSSIDHVQATPGFVGWSWPPSAGMSLQQNMDSMRRHARHFDARVGFTYAVLEIDADEVIGCVYLYPAPSGRHDCEVRTWVRADRAELDRPVHEAVLAWLERDWPFQAVLAHPRR